MSTPGYPVRPFTSLCCRTRVRFTICLKSQHSCRSLLAGTRRRRSPRRDPLYALNCSGVIQVAPVCWTWGVIRSNVMLLPKLTPGLIVLETIFLVVAIVLAWLVWR